MYTNRGWVVYCQETDTVIGHWNKYADAEQFWSDSLCGPDGDDYDWAVFPAVEIDQMIEI